MANEYAGKRILVAEDYALNQELIETMLKMHGCEVDIADNGEEALEMLAEESYDLMMMDIMMPVLDGYDTAKKIREKEKGTGKHMPIVAVTANAQAGDKEKCLAAGMDDYISKPFKKEDIERVLSEYLK